MFLTSFSKTMIYILVSVVNNDLQYWFCSEKINHNSVTIILLQDHSVSYLLFVNLFDI